ncbi:hydroxylamine reductase [Candidatus Saganbacteria bacterium CG08_land_8_20_14_0_20_45_16]|uniref:Hydroxylamine reductase n=1 Tax=Candidatus Saganbacteria bacterium CG08_land_8_20_14_0_20_45_16 TaxID=2014293 RepID=A0A2H0XXJ8_UNCSA|nr:MAG: hydroxylamine reductase [Candidatus Saganbacteria bacterium CG08_land_8_20_14_0_20_45_16]
MSMFCYQCQEASKGLGCDAVGICGKSEQVSNAQDKLILVLKEIGCYASQKRAGSQPVAEEVDVFLIEGLFTTVTNVNFDNERVAKLVAQGEKLRNQLKEGKALPKEVKFGILAEANEDIRSLKELILYGLKGIAAYADHAYVLGYKDEQIFGFIEQALGDLLKDLSIDELVALTIKTGQVGAQALALLDKANTEKYGHPELTEVFTGTKQGPAILVSGHDLLDFEEILKQTEGEGVNVYTHGEMLPANAYPAFKKYKHLVGNYGTSWYNQQKEFDAFNGAIVMTTNCLQKPKESYQNRIFTTGLVAWPGIAHIAKWQTGKAKDFSKVIAKAKELGGLKETQGKKILIGLAHNQVLQIADKVVAAVKSGVIKRFVVMAGCDGRHKNRDYFTRVAENLPKDAVILTAGCAKYRYNMLDLGDIVGIPRVIDAGQCNDSYSLVVIAQKLMEAFGLKSLNDLPVSYDIAWYEQKAVIVLLALLALGVKGIRLGPTLPAFLSPNVAKVLVEKFDIKPTGEVASDVELIMLGR